MITDIEILLAEGIRLTCNMLDFGYALPVLLIIKGLEHCDNALNFDSIQKDVRQSKSLDGSDLDGRHYHSSDAIDQAPYLTEGRWPMGPRFATGIGGRYWIGKGIMRSSYLIKVFINFGPVFIDEFGDFVRKLKSHGFESVKRALLPRY